MLTDTQTAILDFERTHTHWAHAGRRDYEITEQFGVTPVRYAQMLAAVLHNPDALAYDAVTVRRLVRLRDARVKVRSGSAIESA